MAEAETERQFPLTVDYCGVCGMPPEYCEYGPEPTKCYEWMKVNLPAHYAKIEATSRSSVQCFVH